MSVHPQTPKFASEQANKLLRRLAFQVSQTSRSTNPAAVHDLRVAIRRFTQILIVFKPYFHGKETRKIRQKLKRMMRQAGEVRNHDIALKVLARSTAAAVSGLRPKLQGRRKDAEHELNGMLKRWIDRKSSIKWRAALEASLAKNRAEAISIDRSAQQILPPMLKEFLKRGNRAANGIAGAEALHAFRIATKKFRYSLEIFAALYGPPCQTALGKLKHIQDLLGENNDWATVERMLSRHPDGETLTAWLQIKQRKSTEEFCRYWREEFGGPEHSRIWTGVFRRSRPKAPITKKPMGRQQASPAPQSHAAMA